jgi:hypothetical protein
VAVVGSDDPAAVAHAGRLGELLAREGWIVVTGGRDSGVMREVNRGAKRVAGSLTIGILPNAATPVAPEVDVAVITDLNNARNNVIVLTGAVVIACGVGGPGTASEVALAIKSGKTVILLGAAPAAAAFFEAMNAGLVLTAATPEDAVALIQERRLVA